MDWIDEFQRSLGPPVYGFLLQHWVWLAVGGFIVFALLFGGSRSTEGGVWFVFGNRVEGDGDDSDSDGDGGGDGGGGGD